MALGFSAGIMATGGCVRVYVAASDIAKGAGCGIVAEIHFAKHGGGWWAGTEVGEGLPVETPYAGILVGVLAMG